MKTHVLEIVDENDRVIGTELRSKIHGEGLLHRQVHVWFITPKGEVMLQHRAKDKDSYPDMLDATVGGHVEIGQSYEEAAVMETREETGVVLEPKDFVLLEKIHINVQDPATGSFSNAFAKEYGYIYRGKASDLKVEEGKAIGFEPWPIDKLLNPSDSEKAQIVLTFTKPEYKSLFNKLKTLI